MLDGLTTLTHGLWVLIEPPLHRFKNRLMFPAGDASLNARGAAVLDRAGSARVGPVASQRQSVFLIRVVILEALPGGAEVNILIGQIAKVGLDEAAPLA